MVSYHSTEHDESLSNGLSIWDQVVREAVWAAVPKDLGCLWEKGGGAAGSCLIVRYRTWYELRLGDVHWKRL